MVKTRRGSVGVKPFSYRHRRRNATQDNARQRGAVRCFACCKCMLMYAKLYMQENNNNNNNNNPICKAPECQKTSVALADRNSRAN